MPDAHETGTDNGAPKCPLCGGRTQVYARRAIVRCAGLLIMYAAAAVLLLFMPQVTALEVVAIAASAVVGWSLTRKREYWGCPRCRGEQSSGADGDDVD